MKIGDLLIRIGFGLLFVWGGLEKFFEGFLGGVGLDNMASFLSSSGLSFLGDTGTYIVAIVLAALELAAGVLLLINKRRFEAFVFLAFTMFMALALVYLPALIGEGNTANWMNTMIHIALFLSLAGLALQNKK